jgi:hypothetical protein
MYHSDVEDEKREAAEEKSSASLQGKTKKFKVIDVPGLIEKLNDRDKKQMELLRAFSDDDKAKHVMQKKFKKEIVSLIHDNVELIMKDEDATVFSFKELFATVIQLKILNLHVYPQLDSIWHKTRTASMQEAMKHVRRAALYVFDKRKKFYEDQKDLKGLKSFIDGIIRCDLFKAQRSNWTCSDSTDAYDYLLDIYLNIDESTNSYRPPAYESTGERQYQDLTPSLFSISM